MDEEFPVPRFPILEFRIPNSVWHMQDLEYRTMRLGGAGGTWGPRARATGGSDTGCPIPIAGWDIGCPLGGTWLLSVKSESDQVTSDRTRKEGTHAQGGMIGQLRKDKRVSGVHTLWAKKEPLGASKGLWRG